MQFGTALIDPNKWTRSGTVVGEHTHIAKLKLTNAAPLTSAEDNENTISFTETGVEVAKNLLVLGQLQAPGFPPPGGDMSLPTDPTFATVTTTGDITCHANINATTVNVTTDFIAPNVVAEQKVTAPAVESTAIQGQTVTAEEEFTGPKLQVSDHIKAPEVRIPMSGEDDYKFISKDITGTEIVVGGAQIGGEDMPKTTYQPNRISHSIGGAGGFMMDEKSTTIEHGDHKETFDDKGHVRNIGDFEDALVIEEHPYAAGEGILKLIRHMQSVSTSQHEELRRRTLDNIHFMPSDSPMQSFRVTSQGTQQVHLNDAELDLDDPDAIINKTGEELLQALKTAHIPRSLISQNEAKFGLFQNDANANDPQIYLYQQSVDQDSYMKTIIDTQWQYVTNRRSDGGAWKIYWKGYDENDNYLREGARLAVNNFGEHGKVYIGSWNNGLPSQHHNSNDSSFDMVNIQGPIRFSDTPTTAYPSGEIYMKSDSNLGLQTNHVRSLTGQLDFHDIINFTDATVTGLPGIVGAITESPISVDVLGKSLFMLENDTAQVVTQLHHNRLIVPRIEANGTDILQAHGGWDFTNATVTGLAADFHNFYEAGGATVFKENRTIQFLPSGGTQIDHSQIKTKKIGDGETFVTYQDELMDGLNQRFITWYMGGLQMGYISHNEMSMSVPIKAPKTGSSGNFTHCHLTEGAQNVAWEPGRVVKSTGEFCARTDNGVLVGDPKDAPSGSHAICKVEYATRGDMALGIIASTEHVAQQEVLHEHGGITLKAAVQENDGYSMVRVASSGDVMAWVVQPTFDEIDLPPLSGLWQKCVDDTNNYGQHTVLSNHVAVEADGYLAIDNQIINTNAATVQLYHDCVKVYPSDPTLTPDLFSGVYTKTINGIQQDVQVVMHCNSDYSFSFSEHFPGFEARVAALEATIAELTGPD